MRAFKKDLLQIYSHETRNDMAKAAADRTEELILFMLQQKEHINMIFAAAPSQSEFLEYLTQSKTIPWGSINAFHMDEYIGLSGDAPQGFANFLDRHLFSKVGFNGVYTINSDTASPEDECDRYSALLIKYPVDITCLGIGENGHIAFNDPHVADFCDDKIVKKVMLDEVCRTQQVNDGCFAELDRVPKYALTLTIPALTRAKHMVCVVPASSKAWAVNETINADIGHSCPATILRRHDSAYLYIDSDSAKLL